MIDQPPADVQYIVQETVSSNISALHYCIDPIKNIISLCYAEKPHVIAGMIKIRPNQDLKYADLKCSQDDKNKIIYLFSTMGSHSWFTFGVNKKLREKVIQAGDDIRHVDPLKLLEVLCTTPNMKPYLQNIMNDHFIRNEFLDGITPNLNSSATKGKLQQYLPDFAKAVGTTKENLEPFVKERNWKKMIHYLIEHCAI